MNSFDCAGTFNVPERRMNYTLTITLTLTCFLLSACSRGGEKSSSNSDTPMRTEFLDHCQDRPEYTSRKRARTLDKYCLCVFDRTMKNLTEEERIVAGFYLYGETSEGYLKRYPFNVQDAANGMMAASQAIDKAVKSCR